MDSGAYIKGPYYWQEYVATLLSRVHENTGQYCIAVCLGGLRFAGSDKGRTYEGLLDGIMAQYPRPPRFMVWVSFGNDIYPPQKDMRGYEACDFFSTSDHIFSVCSLYEASLRLASDVFDHCLFISNT